MYFGSFSSPAKGTSSSRRVLFSGWKNSLGRLYRSLSNGRGAHTFCTQLTGYCKSPLWARTNELPEPRFLEVVSGWECVTLRQPCTCKQGRVWAGLQPTRSGALSQVADLWSRAYLPPDAHVAFLLPLTARAPAPGPPRGLGGWGGGGGREERGKGEDADPKFFFWADWRGPRPGTPLQLRVTPPLWSWGERPGETNKTAGEAGGGKTSSRASSHCFSDSLLYSEHPDPQPTPGAPACRLTCAPRPPDAPSAPRSQAPLLAAFALEPAQPRPDPPGGHQDEGGPLRDARRRHAEPHQPGPPRGGAFLPVQPVPAVHEAAAGLRWAGRRAQGAGPGPGRGSWGAAWTFSPGAGRAGLTAEKQLGARFPAAPEPLASAPCLLHLASFWQVVPAYR